MYGRIITGILALLVSVALTAGQDTQRPSTTRPAAREDGVVSSIPFELTSNKPFVQVQVNDSQPLWFILDTGNAGGFALDRKRALALGLEIEGERETHTGAGEGTLVTIGHTQGVTFRVGDVQLDRQSAAILPLDHVAAYEGRAVDGLIGRSFISRFVLEIDYRARIIRLHDPRSYDYSGPGQVIPLKSIGGLIATRASITAPGRDPIVCDLVIDTGVRTTLVLNRPFVEENKLLESLPKTFAATTGGGAGGECKGVVGRLESVQLGPFLIKKPVAIFSQDRSGVLASRSFAGIIGGQILKRCKVVFDYTGQRMILDPYADVPAPYEYDMSGTFLIARGPDFKEFVVQSVAEGSPAAEASLRRGDVIRAIDDRPAAEFTLEEVRQLFKREGRKYRLDVQRGDERFQAELKLRRTV